MCVSILSELFKQNTFDLLDLNNSNSAITIFDAVYPFSVSILMDPFIWIYGKKQYLSNSQNMESDKWFKRSKSKY